MNGAFGADVDELPANNDADYARPQGGGGGGGAFGEAVFDDIGEQFENASLGSAGRFARSAAAASRKRPAALALPTNYDSDGVSTAEGSAAGRPRSGRPRKRRRVNRFADDYDDDAKDNREADADALAAAVKQPTDEPAPLNQDDDYCTDDDDGADVEEIVVGNEIDAANAAGDIDNGVADVFALPIERKKIVRKVSRRNQPYCFLCATAATSKTGADVPKRTHLVNNVRSLIQSGASDLAIIQEARGQYAAIQAVQHLPDWSGQQIIAHFKQHDPDPMLRARIANRNISIMMDIMERSQLVSRCVKTGVKTVNYTDARMYLHLIATQERLQSNLRQAAV